MPRPEKCRKINAQPGTTYFKPKGVPLKELTDVYLSIDGLEAIRLADLAGLTHAEAAERMAVSRQTFGRIVAKARGIVADALVNGKALQVAGGHVVVDQAPDSTPIASESGTDTAPDASIARIAITCDGPSLDDSLDPLFGRAAGFLIVDVATGATTHISNTIGQQVAHHAGIQAAELLATNKVNALITGYIGPKAYGALSAAGIRVALGFESITARDALDRFSTGKYQWADGPNRRLNG